MSPQVAQSLRQATAISAMRTIAKELGPDTVEDVNAVQEAAAWATACILERTEGLAHRVAKVVGMGLPDPVLAVTGAGSLEVPWTNYLFRAMGGDPRRSSRCVGNALAHAAMRTMAGGDSESQENLEVFREAYLGQAVTREYQNGSSGPHVRCNCGHGCNVDLVLVCDTAAVAIEQKVKAGASDWKCDECGGKQAEVYRRLFPEWVRNHRAFRGSAAVGQPEEGFYYLSPTGREVSSEGGAADTDPAEPPNSEPKGWKAITHHDLAVAMAEAWANAVGNGERGFTSQGDKFRMLSFFLDMASTVAGSLATDLEVAAAWYLAPSDVALALEVERRLGAHPIFNRICEVFDGGK